MNQKTRIFWITLVVIFTFIGCGSGNSPKNVVKNYIKGVQNFDAELVWKNSEVDSFDETLLKEEKEKKFQDYKTEFDKKEHERFKLFTPNANFKIFSVEKDDSKYKVFVEVNYPSEKPFKLDKFKTAKKLKITFLVRSKKGYNYVDDFYWKTIEYNRQYDNMILSEFVKANKEKDLNLCYEKCKSALNHDKEYFSDINILTDNLLKEICVCEEGLSKSELHKFLSVTQDEVTDDTSTYSYEARWNRTDSGDYYYMPGGSGTIVEGSYVSFYITNNLKCTSVNILLKIDARTRRYEDSLYIYDSQPLSTAKEIHNLKPGESRYVSTHLAGTNIVKPKNPDNALTSILALAGNLSTAAAGDWAKRTPIDRNSVKISIKSISKN
ncbi:MAG: DUF4878 domain-containing protein [Candidatus Aminicenantes bacterium]|nr:DUF4878 domain-containing protein [Candidatus Aminicenantes bacterium]NIM80708.1 DUF4878 domain-containing protein [Candidatus Aminicenantes bacterium]NIN20083.1 DUF4878 domain-containing protein [Candidatus Aminicenantes bacterium]NIN43870.1 DUF4878 domain-containing protein [Candidatus Aminicenantes bacterium]NIN86679.1 DUF4878 domain-containing protein [Candidatus Aminicenantes bacterium]